MTKAKLVFLLAFILVFGAGAVVGMVQQHHGHEPARGHSMLSEQLGLTPDQQQQMKQIWSAVDNARHEGSDKRREFQKLRDQELRNQLTDAQKAKFDSIAMEYQQKIAELNTQHEKLVESAVTSTKAILNDSQRAKYDEIRKSWAEHAGRRGPRGMGRGETRPTTNPSEAQQK